MQQDIQNKMGTKLQKYKNKKNLVKKKIGQNPNEKTPNPPLSPRELGSSRGHSPVST